MKIQQLKASKLILDKVTTRDVNFWESILVEYFRNGQFLEVLGLFRRMKMMAVGISGRVLHCSLTSCTELGFLEFCRGLHGDSFKSNLNDDKFFGASLIGFYAKYHNLEVARRVFEEITMKDVGLYTAMITFCAQRGHSHSREAFWVVYCMRKEGYDPNTVSLVSLLFAAGQIHGLEEGQSVHSYAIRSGNYHFCEVFETSLVDMYIKCGDVFSAWRILNSTASVAPWNSMISGLLRRGCGVEALKLLPFMNRSKLKPDGFTLASALIVCADLHLLYPGLSIHGYIIRCKINLDLVAVTALIELYAKCSGVHRAKKLFDGVKARDVVLYNVIIAGYLHAGLTEESIQMFGGMVHGGVNPNTATILIVLTGCADLLDAGKGQLVHGYVLRCGWGLNVEVSNHILHMYAKCGHLNIARKVFDGMRDKDLVSWTSMMMGYVHHGHASEAISLFLIMQEARVIPDAITLLVLLQAFTLLGCLKQTKEIHGYLHRTHLEMNVYTTNCLISAYSKCGRLDISEVLFNRIRRHDQASWNTMIAAYGMHGDCRAALDCYHKMQDQNFRPDEFTFTSVLSACSHSGMVEVGYNIFKSMNLKHLVRPREEHYSCMVDMLGRAGHLKEAYSLLKSSPFGQTVDAVTSLLTACKIHRNHELGELVGQNLLTLQPSNSGAYALTANMYAEEGKWLEVERIRLMTQARCVTNALGWSLVESSGLPNRN